MKKFVSIIFCMLILLGLISAGVYAKSDSSDDVFVSIADENGNLVLAYQSVPLSDADADGALTVNDALSVAHKEYYRDGTNGFSSEKTQYGISLTKLWGVANGGAYGCFVNDVPALSYGDFVQPGDHIYAYIYTDMVGYSDVYGYFDQRTVTVDAGESVALTLYMKDIWTSDISPVANAVILINGEDAGVRTDENGKATVTVESRKDVVISARSEDHVLVPPVCVVSVNDFGRLLTLMWFALICIVTAILGIFIMKKGSNHE